jgi:hypothetical protein
VLHRYNTIALRVLGQDVECFLFVARFGEERLWKQDAQGPLNELDFTYVMSHGDGDDAVQFFVAPATWRAGAFDTLLSAVADDQTGPVLFFNAARRTAFAPYDGGADLFLESAEEAHRMKMHFEAWLSSRPDGL